VTCHAEAPDVMADTIALRRGLKPSHCESRRLTPCKAFPLFYFRRGIDSHQQSLFYSRGIDSRQQSGYDGRFDPAPIRDRRDPRQMLSNASRRQEATVHSLTVDCRVPRPDSIAPPRGYGPQSGRDNKDLPRPLAMLDLHRAAKRLRSTVGP
jgi:hypothetical protein